MMNEKILIVDDDPVVQVLHKALIKKSGVSSHILTFKNGKEALNYLMEEPGNDGSYLVLLDLNMPVMNGWELLEELNGKGISCYVKVAVVTSSINQEDREKAKAYEMVVAYIAKPLNCPEEIKEILHKFVLAPSF